MKIIVEWILVLFIGNIIITLFISPITKRIEKFLKKTLPSWYYNNYYKSAATNNTKRASVISLFILVFSILIVSEIIVLSIFNPTIPILDKVIDAHPEPINIVLLFIILFINLIIFIIAIRIEGIYMTITRFNQMLAIIRPDIDNIKYYTIKKEWALMKSKDDYKTIITELLTNYPILIDKKKFQDEVKIFKISESKAKKTTTE